MSTGRTIQVAVTHTLVGIGIGSLIEAMLPRFTNDASLTTLAFEMLVQVGLNGAALAAVTGFLRQESDPTFGIPFGAALFQAQPELAARIESVSAAAKAQVVQAVQKMVPREPTV